MELDTKKKLTTVASWLIFLFGGIEYAVIIPTLNLFLLDLGAPQYFLGMVISAFSFSGLFAAPIFGIWQDRTSKTKSLILFANMFEIGGNFLYFVGRSQYILLAARLLAGVGAGVTATIFSQISRTTPANKRTAVISMAMASRQFGIVFGPGFNLFLSKIDFKIGPFEVNDFTSPGLFMMIMWILLQILMIFIYFDLPLVSDESNFDEQVKGQSSTNGVTNETLTNNDLYERIEESDEMRRQPVRSTRCDIDENKSISNSNGVYKNVEVQSSDYGTVTVNNEEEVKNKNEEDMEFSLILKIRYKDMTFFQKINELIREEIVVILFAQFVFLFNQTALEASLTPLAETFLSFGEIPNSLLYCGAGFELIIGYFFVRWMSKRCQDRTLSIIGLLTEILPLIILLYFLPRAIPGDFDGNVAWFISCLFIQILGFPFIAVASIASFSKKTPLKIQGFGQGIRRAVGNTATIIGPLWSGGALNKPYILVSVLLAILVLCLVSIV
ncbi:uncharacterized protein [Antedon mediterranea]|uniref:uncharacterized protein n=1 Tax=Antedon mediterranea TaxID=105859 RepID=UPI003AF93B66